MRGRSPGRVQRRTGGTFMDEERFNLALRAFLKEVGVTSQREPGAARFPQGGRRHLTAGNREDRARARAAGGSPPAAHGAHLAGCPRAKPCDRGRYSARLGALLRQYGRARRVWVMDRGIPTEAVLAEMRASDPPGSIRWERRRGVCRVLRSGCWPNLGSRSARVGRSNYWPRTTNFMCSQRASIGSAKSARCAGGN
jgi:hypothetical protein